MRTKLPTAQLLPSGQYRCQVMVGGKRVSVVDADPNMAQAKAVALKARIIEENSALVDRKAGNITLENAIKSYIADRKNVLSPSTINGYNEILRNRFKTLMPKMVRNIDASDIQAAVNMDAKAVGYKTLKNALMLIVPAIAQYKEIEIKRIKLPQRKKVEHPYLDEEGIMELFEAISGNVAEIPILLALWLGMRRSEILGLCWDSVDFENGRIKVQRTYVKNGDKGYVLREEMKTSESRRTLDCPGYILSKLEAYQPDPALRKGRIFKMHPNTIYSSLNRVCKKRGIDFVGVHGLRHTNASVMLSIGVLDKVAMARGGWATDVTMKQVYQHVFQSDRETAGEKVNAYFDTILSGTIPSEKMHTNLHTNESESSDTSG